MIVYAGIDEAGYGPLFGPLVIGRAALALPDDWESIPTDIPLENKTENKREKPEDQPDAQPRDCLWKRLDDALCKTLSGRRGRIAVNDSKKLHSKASGVTHLERGVLAFAAQIGQSGQANKNPRTVDQWLELLGETLLMAGKTEEAYKVLTKALSRTKGKALTLEALKRAKEGL